MHRTCLYRAPFSSPEWFFIETAIPSSARMTRRVTARITMVPYKRYSKFSLISEFS